MFSKAVPLFLMLTLGACDKERLRRRPALDLQMDYRTHKHEHEQWMTPEGRSASTENTIFHHGDEELAKSNLETIDFFNSNSEENTDDSQSLSEAPSAADYVIRALKMRDKAYAPKFHSFSESASLAMPHYSSIGDSSTMTLPTFRTVSKSNSNSNSNKAQIYQATADTSNLDVPSYRSNEHTSQLNTFQTNSHVKPIQHEAYSANLDTETYKINYRANKADAKTQSAETDESDTQFQSYDTVVLNTQKQAEQIAQQYADQYLKTIEQGTIKLQRQQEDMWRAITGTQPTPSHDGIDGARRIEKEKMSLIHSKEAKRVPANRGYSDDDTTETTRWGYGSDQNGNEEETTDRTNNQSYDNYDPSEQDRKTTSKRVLPPYQRLATYIGQVEDHRGVDEYKEEKIEEDQYDLHKKSKINYAPSREQFRHNSVRYTDIYRPNTRDYSLNMPNDRQQHRPNVDMEQLISHARDYHAHLKARDENQGQHKEEIRYNVIEDGQHLLSIPQSLVSILRQMGSVTAGTPVQEIKVVSMQITPQISTPETPVQEEQHTTTTSTTQNPQHIIVSAAKPNQDYNHKPITMINGLPVYNPYNVDLQTLRKILSSPMMIPTENGGHFKVVPQVDDQMKQSMYKNEDAMYMQLPQRDSWEGAESQHREIRDSSGRRGKKAKKLKKKHVETGNWGGSWVEGLLPEPSTQLTPPPVKH